MASIDPETGELVVRIAYDGAGRAGKTTNIVKLSEKLKRKVFTPDQPGDRTVYFDWMKYKGGNFEGLPIRCEMVTVPGQELLKERRELLLQQADVVVEVFDVSQTTVSDLRERVTAIREAKGHALPRNVLVQLNKCDLAPKTPLQDLQAACKSFDPPVRCIQAIAATGKAVQETFVYSVREALNRVRALRAQGLLPTAEDMSGDGLLAWLKKNEAVMKGQASISPPAQDSNHQSQSNFAPAATQIEPANQSSSHQNPDDPPALPQTNVAPGRIWPPKVGRSVLESIDMGQCKLESAGEQAWYGALDQDWHLYSGADCLFENEQDGIQELLRWAKHCSTLEALLSSPRCIVLAPVKSHQDSHWRLWQLVSSRKSLRDEVSLLLDEHDQEVVAHHLCSMANKLLDMEANRQYCVNLPNCTLDSVGGNSNLVQYVGFLAAPPPADATLSDVPTNDRVLINREFASLMRDAWPDRKGLLQALNALRQSSFEPRSRDIATVLAQLLETHIKSAAS